MSPSDCRQERSLVQTVTRGPRAFLSREEAQCFIKESVPCHSPLPAPGPEPPAPHPTFWLPPCRCGLLNCEAVLELLTRRLDGTSECVQMVRPCPWGVRTGAGGRAGVAGHLLTGV